MTHTKFTELLNLYLDHEISAEDATALEVEIQNNPARREIYRQYCRMQKGCAQLAGHFSGAQSPAPAPVRDLSARRQGSRRYFAAWTAGVGMVAAACFAVILINSEPTIEPAEPIAGLTRPGLVAQVTTTPEEVSPAVFSLPQLRERTNEMHSVFAPALLTPASNRQAPRSLYVNAQGDRFDWMDRINTPATDEDYAFHVRPTVAEGQRTYRSGRPIDGRVEMTAFQFQR